jgi:hypothetical protein
MKIAKIMSILRIHAPILLILEICLDMARGLGKMHSASGLKNSGVLKAVISRPVANPVLKSSAKKGRA